MIATPSTDLTTIVDTKILDALRGGTLTLSALAKAIAPKAPIAEAPAVVPLPREITAEQRAAIERMPTVYGKVVPTRRCSLTLAEIDTLIVERDTLDTVKKTAEGRLEDITIIAHNHLDIETEKKFAEGERPEKDAKGHYVTAARFGVPGQGKEFSRETRETSASLDLSALEALVDSGDLTHEQYLSMTTQVRVVDEAKIMLAVRKEPGLIKALAKATRAGGKSTSMYLRLKK